MNLYEKLIYSIILGIVITLASGLIPNIGGGLGVQGFGFPFPWMMQAIYPGAPMTFDWIALILDSVIWSIFAIIVIHFFVDKKE
jgi:hypothetical protein